MHQALPSQDQELELLTHAAREAGRIAMSFFGGSPEIWWKENDSPVSEGDYAVDRYLRQMLLETRPDYGWVSEESEVEGSIPSTTREDRFFVVDPIDGTRAYLRGDATWCVSIALVSGNRPLAGAIFAPVFGEMFTVTRSGEARLNGERIFVPQVGDRPLSVAVPDQFIKPFRRLDADVRGGFSTERGAPSLAYRLCQVAAQRLDATLIRPRAHDWDIAAGDLLLERAGAALLDGDGDRLVYGRDARRHGLLVAASHAAMPRIAALAKAVLREDAVKSP
ncbi:3'(2'),5'-bisphosphate nucleotidase CysQ [Fulvimarina sp. 2208YS6-2-32]|uniref:3'(2'),5'-bisphosphate nucleotidase CysQ n=1 Tax=Fulvimarina uroteuthidis TaxID=3098149 RepID=A0ABU5I1T5_9HYPH|nr:3'(2'),5'-bisphosphate nucleotidase CysQ [Fulvimarina sp. 2208YS6-2-32]MDY8109335.1 3'(2'),5'-bisphosphate nucleotidase CysQ [Fulvimarina sp. 2208YS6-2-32]